MYTQKSKLHLIPVDILILYRYNKVLNKLRTKLLSQLTMKCEKAAAHEHLTLLTYFQYLSAARYYHFF